MTRQIVEVRGEESHVALPLAEVTVGTLKGWFRDALHIPFFSDAILDGEVVPTWYVVRDGDRLCFSKRTGFRRGGNEPQVQCEAEGLLQAYSDLRRIAEQVKKQRLPADRAIDVMTGMVMEWCEAHFGQPAQEERAVLAEVVRRLASLETALAEGGVGISTERLNETEQKVVDALGDGELKGEAVANRAGCEFNGYFKGVLSSLRRRGILGNNHPGYFVIGRRKSGQRQD